MRRLNLLPHERRLRLRREMVLNASLKLVMTGLVALTLLTALGIAGSGVLWLYPWLTGQPGEDELALELAQFGELKSSVTQQNEVLRAVEQLGDERVVWSQVLRRLLATLPPGVKLEHVSVNLDQLTVIIAGVAAQRTTLVVFESRLRTLPWVKSLDAPPENLLLRENAFYTFTLHIDPTKITSSQDAEFPQS